MTTDPTLDQDRVSGPRDATGAGSGDGGEAADGGDAVDGTPGTGGSDPGTAVNPLDDARAELPAYDPERVAATIERHAGDLLAALADRDWFAGLDLDPRSLSDPAVVGYELRWARATGGIDRGLTVHHLPGEEGLLTHVQYTRELDHAEGSTEAATRLSVTVIPERERAYALLSLRRRADPRDVDRTGTYTVLDPELDVDEVVDTDRAAPIDDLEARVFGSVEGTAVRTCDAYGDGGVYYRRFPPGGWVEKYAPSEATPEATAGSLLDA